jgi:hypothetical protein
MGRRLKNYAISRDAILQAECGKFSDMRIGLYFLRGMQRQHRLGDTDDTALDKIEHPMNQDVILLRIIDARHPEVRGCDVVDSVLLEDKDAVEILNEGRPDGIVVGRQKLILPGT